ncbi:hypothetical protein FA15DRAFT_660073 [Coprinopsis marcescibilis]|uniref:Uncharacterized protein n=1 Tax=Coprinopsis marcescibilis TaxID=230819 RepID=A0A5C3KGI7_COPMA|nr:hypothetical protein FA15DRAFT_660073 [Coprinopsis marcescibilis]
MPQVPVTQVVIIVIFSVLGIICVSILAIYIGKKYGNGAHQDLDSPSSPTLQIGAVQHPTQPNSLLPLHQQPNRNSAHQQHSGVPPRQGHELGDVERARLSRVSAFQRAPALIDGEPSPTSPHRSSRRSPRRARPSPQPPNPGPNPEDGLWTATVEKMQAVQDKFAELQQLNERAHQTRGNPAYPDSLARMANLRREITELLDSQIQRPHSTAHESTAPPPHQPEASTSTLGPRSGVLKPKDLAWRDAPNRHPPQHEPSSSTAASKRGTLYDQMVEIQVLLWRISNLQATNTPEARTTIEILQRRVAELSHNEEPEDSSSGRDGGQGIDPRESRAESSNPVGETVNSTMDPIIEEMRGDGDEQALESSGQRPISTQSATGSLPPAYVELNPFETK